VTDGERAAAIVNAKALVSAALAERREPHSLAERFVRLVPEVRAAILDELSPVARARLLYSWKLWARPTQLAPTDNDWSVLLWLAGRGWGKSKAGSEWVRERVDSGQARSIGLIGPSLQDIRDTMLGEGRTTRGEGLLNVWPPSQKPEWEPSKRRITFHTGAVATIYTAEEPEMRGPNLDTVWADELAKWRYLDTLWPNLEMTLRKPGATPPRIAITTTPKPLAVLREIMADPWTRTVRGFTFDNAANLDPRWLAKMLKHKGTRTGDQELYAEILGDNPDALFRQSTIDASRYTPTLDDAGDIVWPKLDRVVVAVDPAVSTGRSSDETGIVVLGSMAGRIFVLEDFTGRHTPDAWTSIVAKAAERWRRRGAAVLVVAETNRGGDLVEAALRAKRSSLPIALVRATKGKELRAEPVSALYEEGRVEHVGRLVELEQEMTEWNPATSTKSPNRLDALVWGLWELASLGEDETPMAETAALPAPGPRFDPFQSRREVGEGAPRAASFAVGWGGNMSGRRI
jgi:phage terminase large subunit-like protein